MAGENYLRIAQGYEPGEPASFLEKAFYIFWVMIGAFKVVLMRIKVRMAKGEFGPSPVKDKPKILKKIVKMY